MQKYHIYSHIIAPAYFLHSLDFEKKFSAVKITGIFFRNKKGVNVF